MGNCVGICVDVMFIVALDPKSSSILEVASCNRRIHRYSLGFRMRRKFSFLDSCHCPSAGLRVSISTRTSSSRSIFVTSEFGGILDISMSWNCSDNCVGVSVDGYLCSDLN